MSLRSHKINIRERQTSTLSNEEAGKENLSPTAAIAVSAVDCHHRHRHRQYHQHRQRRTRSRPQEYPDTKNMPRFFRSNSSPTKASSSSSPLVSASPVRRQGSSGLLGPGQLCWRTRSLDKASPLAPSTSKEDFFRVCVLEVRDGEGEVAEQAQPINTGILQIRRDDLGTRKSKKKVWATPPPKLFSLLRRRSSSQPRKKCPCTTASSASTSSSSEELPAPVVVWQAPPPTSILTKKIRSLGNACSSSFECTTSSSKNHRSTESVQSVSTSDSTVKQSPLRTYREARRNLEPIGHYKMDRKVPVESVLRKSSHSRSRSADQLSSLKPADGEKDRRFPVESVLRKSSHARCHSADQLGSLNAVDGEKDRRFQLDVLRKSSFSRSYSADRQCFSNCLMSNQQQQRSLSHSADRNGYNAATEISQQQKQPSIINNAPSAEQQTFPELEGEPAFGLTPPRNAERKIRFRSDAIANKVNKSQSSKLQKQRPSYERKKNVDKSGKSFLSNSTMNDISITCGLGLAFLCPYATRCITDDDSCTGENNST